MLEDYYSIIITEDGQLKALPMILRGYIPTMDKLPMFLLRLGTEVKKKKIHKHTFLLIYIYELYLFTIIIFYYYLTLLYHFFPRLIGRMNNYV